LFSVLLLAGSHCSSYEPGKAQTPRVALVMKTLNNPFFIDMLKGAKEAAERLNVHLVVQAAETELDTEKQMQIIENLIQTQVDVLCITPSGSREIVPAVVKANQAGIPVLIVDTRLDPDAVKEAGAEIEGFIGCDNYEGGRIAAQFIDKLMNSQARIVVLEGISGHETGDERLRGFNDVISEIPGLKVVASQTANWQRDQGFNVFQNILQAHREIDVLFASNDLMALGALEAIAIAGRGPQIKVVGFDALDEVKKAIKKGAIEASVEQHPEEMGRLAVENAVMILEGKDIPDEIPVAIELITRENLER